MALHTIIGSLFGPDVTFTDLRAMFGFAKAGKTSVLPRLHEVRNQILKRQLYSFERDNLYENSGHYDPEIDDMIRSFWLSDDASTDGDGLKRIWTDPITGSSSMKSVRVSLFPTRLDARERFVELYGERCTAISKAKGHKKNLIPSAEYVWKLKPSYVMYQVFFQIETKRDSSEINGIL